MKLVLCAGEVKFTALPKAKLHYPQDKFTYEVNTTCLQGKFSCKALSGTLHVIIHLIADILHSFHGGVVASFIYVTKGDVFGAVVLGGKLYRLAYLGLKPAVDDIDHSAALHYLGKPTGNVAYGREHRAQLCIGMRTKGHLAELYVCPTVVCAAEDEYRVNFLALKEAAFNKPLKPIDKGGRVAAIRIVVARVANG